MGGQREYLIKPMKDISNILKDAMHKDMVNHPSHYNQGIEVIDFIESHKLDFNEGNVVKYCVRYKYKNGLEDLKKAKWYLDRLISNYEKDKKEI